MNITAAAVYPFSTIITTGAVQSAKSSHKLSPQHLLARAKESSLNIFLPFAIKDLSPRFLPFQFTPY
jgi:hypothetical protein